tara:strand:- start:19708 stop:21114 length:1407 start_codon:yes stop_codon:yes gene_type:complete
MFEIKEINKIWQGFENKSYLDHSCKINNVITDSRIIKENELFVPLVGDKFDGNEFIKDAFNRGSRLAIVQRGKESKVPKGMYYWVVDNTLDAYQELAHIYRLKLNIPIIAITGSAGKTTTKELLKSALSPLGKINSTELNFNNEIGVSKTILNTRNFHRALILEMGMRGQGQIDKLSYISKPDISIITNIGNAHIGLLGSLEKITEAKCEIVNYMNPEGIVIIPKEEILLGKTINKNWKGKVLKVSLESSKIDFKNKLNIHSSKVISKRISNIIGISLADNEVSILGKVFKSNLSGKHNELNLLLSLAVGFVLNIKYKDNNLIQMEKISGRSCLTNHRGINILDETYNSSPESCKACLDLLMTYPGRHFAILGTMLELGIYSDQLHKDLFSYINKMNLNGIVFLCDKSQQSKIAYLSENIKDIKIVDSINDAAASINQFIKVNDYLLIKGSRKLKMESIIPLINIKKY